MLPKPPFASELTSEEELTAFAELRGRLAHVWTALTASDDRPCTSVIVPSMTLDQRELRKLTGASFYEERLLFLLIRLRNPRAQIVYVTSQPVHPLILRSVHCLKLLVGVPPPCPRAIDAALAYDASPRPLTEKILERPRLLAADPRGVPDRDQRAYLTVFNSTPLERRLAVLLGIPLDGLDHQCDISARSPGSRQGVPRRRRGDPVSGSRT